MEKVLAVGFDKNGKPWTMLTQDDRYVLGWDIDHRRVGRGYVRRCCSAGGELHPLRFADVVSTYWVRKGFDVVNGGKQIRVMPSNCRGILSRIPKAEDRYDDKGPDLIV